MPRVDGTYSAPYPDVVPDTTIESEVHNGTVADLVLDANAPRPITAGGTGANNAKSARENLGVEAATIQVTNYDSHVWEAGSFYSLNGATGQPVATDCSGVCTIIEKGATDDVYLRVVSQTNSDVYLRARTGGTWSGWVAQSGMYVSAGGGDTIDNDLTIEAASPVLFLNKTSPTGEAAIWSRYNGVARWSMQLANATADAAANAGSDFLLRAHATDGSVLHSALTIIRSTGDTTVHKRLNVTGNYVGSAYTYAGFGIMSKAGATGAWDANPWNLQWTGVLTYWVGDVNCGTIALTSDYRTKKDIVPLTSMWDTVKALNPISYTQAEFSPPAHTARAAGSGPLFAADDIERWGFIAHELQETLIPSAANGVKDSPDTIQSPNPWTLIAALTSALQEAMERIEALEAAQPP